MSVAEQTLIGAALLNSSVVDLALSAGVGTGHFTSATRQSIWQTIVKLSLTDSPADESGVILAMGVGPHCEEIFACSQLSPTTAHAKKSIENVCWEYQKNRLKPALNDVVARIDDGADKQDIQQAMASLPEISDTLQQNHRPIAEIVREAKEWAQNEIDDKPDNRRLITTGLPSFDKFCMPMQPHEYVLLGARTSTGKSSFLSQIAGHNLNRGMKVAYFTLETADVPVAKQIAGQRAKVNLRKFRGELRDRQDRFMKELDTLSKQPLMVFDKDLSPEQITSRCRMLASSFQPDLTIIDYIGIMNSGEKAAYERMTQLSKMMIPLKKMLPGVLLVAAQLSRGSEREDREPNRTDFRDSGSLEEDAHRIMALHRPSKDFGGVEQGFGRTVYDYKILQLKLRDGPTEAVKCKFNAPHTTFFEESNLEAV